MKNSKRINWIVILLALALCAMNCYAGNEPGEPGGGGGGGGDICELVGQSDEDIMWALASGDYTSVGCIEFQFVTGPMKNQINVPQGRLHVMSELPSPTVSTPQAIEVVPGLYGIQRVVGNEVDIINNDGEKITFSFPNASAVASPVEQNSTWHASLKKVNAQGTPTTNSPVYYDLYTFNGLERVRFDANTNSVNYLRMVNLRTAEGQIYESGEFGVSYIYDKDGAIRQVMAPTRLLDIVTFHAFKYEVRFYKPEDVSSSVNTNGLYVPLTGAQPFEYWTIETPCATAVGIVWETTGTVTNITRSPVANSYNTMYISRTVGGTTRTRVFTYSEAQNTWKATQDGGETFEQSTMEWDASKINCVRTKSFYAASEAPVSKQIKRLTKQAWGQALMEVENMVSATNSRTRIFTYYTNERFSQTNYPDGSWQVGWTGGGFPIQDDGRYSQVKSIIETDGSWQTMDYDALGRGTVTVSSWKNAALTTNAALAKAVYMDYTTHEASDVPLEFDERPRTETEMIEGIVTKKTFYTYKTNSVGAQIHITEQCASQSGSYGDAANLRTIKTYYPPYSGGSFQDRLNQGRIKTVETPDGLLKTYEYALGDLTINPADPAASSFTVNTNGLDWRVTVINGTTNNPAGVAGKTVKQVTVKDRYSNNALIETYVYTGSVYERIDWTAKQFDVYGHAIEIWYADGTQESGYWGSGCCGKDSGTERDGTEFTYTYDLNTRPISETRLTTNGTSGSTIEISYDAANRKTGTSRYAPGITPLTTQAGFDMIGRPLLQIGEDGTTNRWSYNDTSRIVTAAYPGGATVITEKYLDGRVKQQTGTAKVHSAYDYGVNTDGTQWSMEYTGPDGTNSSAWKKTITDFLGRLVKIEKPGFNNSVLVTETFYNSRGLPWKTVQSASSSTLLTRLTEYNELGEAVRTAIDLNGNGQIDLAADRITEEETVYQKVGNNWHQGTDYRTYPEDGSSYHLETAGKCVRLTGLGSQSAIGKLKSELYLIDRFGYLTVQKVYVDRSGKTVTVITDVPDSNADEVSVTVNRMLQSETSRSGVTTKYQYDALTRRIGSSTESVDTRHSPPVTRRIASLIHYNNKGQVDWQEDAASNRTWFAYDNVTGLKTAITNMLGQTTLYEYNARGDITVVGGSSQYPVAYGYDDYGRKTDLYTLRGATSGWDRTQWLYDDATGLVTNKLYADGNGPSYTYTPDGRLATRTWARMVGSSRLATHYYYDAVGQLTNTVYSDGTPSISIAYNRLGQKTQVIDASGTNTFSYNDLLQLTNETQQSSFSLHRSYDSLGRFSGYDLQSQVSSLQSVAYQYDDLGRFSSVSSSVQSVSSVVSYSYLEGSSLISGYSITDPSSSFEFQVSNFYEANRNLKASVSSTFDTNGVSQFDYTYDALGRRTQRLDTLLPSVQTNLFGYNDRSELTAAQISTNNYGYGYDFIGNRTSATGNNQLAVYTANALNQYTLITNNSEQITFSYDADGNLLFDGIRTYTWNGENRLISVIPVSLTNGAKKLEFVYDAQGRRISKDVYQRVTDNWELITQTKFAYDDWAMICEISNQNSSITTNSYVYGLDLSGSRQDAGTIGGLLSVIKGGAGTPSTPYFPTYDANGNVTGYISTNGTVVARYVYDAYGKLINSSGDMTDDFNILFSSKYLDRETGLYYYGYRFYSPILVRWLSRDPAEENGGRNLYAFCVNNPVNQTDSLGLWYVDFNISGPGVTGGVMVNGSGFYPYLGGGAVTPGASITFSTSNPTTGWNAAFQAGVWGGFQVGYALETPAGQNPWYGEIGFVTPGVNYSAFYVWGPFGPGVKPGVQPGVQPGVKPGVQPPSVNWDICSSGNDDSGNDDGGSDE